MSKLRNNPKIKQIVKNLTKQLERARDAQMETERRLQELRWQQIAEGRSVSYKLEA